METHEKPGPGALGRFKLRLQVLLKKSERK